MKLPAGFSKMFLSTIPGYFRLFAIAVLLGTVVVSALFTHYEISAMRGFILRSSEQTVDAQSKMIDNWFNGQAAEARFLSEMPAARRGDIASFEASLDAFRRNHPEFVYAAFIDAAGKAPSGYDVSDREYFHLAKRGEEHVSDVIYGRISGTPMIVFSAPVFGYDGEFRGLVACAVKLATITSIMEDFHIGKTGETFLVNERGVMVTQSRFGLELARERVVEDSGSTRIKVDTAAFRKTSSGVYRNYRGQRVLGAYAALEKPGWFVVREIEESEMLTPVYYQLQVSGLFGVGLVAAVFALMAFFSRRIGDTTAVLVEQANLIEHGDYAAARLTKVPGDAPEELVRIQEAFGTMTARLVQDIEELFALNTTLAETEERFRSLAENAIVGVYIIEGDGKIMYFNPKMYEITGYSAAEAKGLKLFLDFIHPDDVAVVGDRLRQRVEGKEQTASYEFRIIRKDGRVAETHAFSAVCMIGGKFAIIGTLIDVTERKAWEKALRESERKSSAIVRAMPDALVRLSGDGTFLEIISTKGSPSLTNPLASVGNSLDSIWPQDIAGKARGYIAQALVSGEAQSYEYELRWQDCLRTKEVRILPYAEDEVLLVIRDISERKDMERMLESMSYHDALTGLYNRAFFNQELYRASRDGLWPIGIIVADVDGLKTVNDALGHQEGDRLLNAAAAALSTEGDNSILARIGGDEFAILVTGASREALEAECAQVRANIARYNETSNAAPLSISLGYAVGREDGVLDIFRRADDAMYRNKYENRWQAAGVLQQYISTVTGAGDKQA